MEKYISLLGVLMIIVSGVYSMVKACMDGLVHGLTGLFTGSLASSIRCWQKGDRFPVCLLVLGIILLILGTHLAEAFQ
jgi:hypothetical protein